MNFGLPLNMVMTPEKYYYMNAFWYASHQDWLWDNMFWNLSIQGTFDRMNMNDKKNIIDDNNAFIFVTSLDRLREI